MWSTMLCAEQVQIEHSNEMEDELRVAKQLNVLTKAKHSQNVRDLHRHKCGYGPALPVKEMLFYKKTLHTSFPEIDELMRNLDVQIGRVGLALSVYCLKTIYLCQATL